MSLSDNPIAAAGADLLGRSRLAHGLVDLLLGFPPESSFRLGVFGEWGSGKTSVLELVGAEMEVRGQVAIWLLPWALGSADSVLEHLLEDLGARLDVGRGMFGGLSRMASKSSTASAVAEGLDIRLTAALRVARPALDAAAARLKQKHGEGLLRAIHEKLDGRRVVVLVDDLDRTDPGKIPDLLLTLREVMSLPGVHFILALSPDIVRKGLLVAHPEWMDEAQDFLDKIIEYPFVLVPPTQDEVLRAARFLLTSEGDFPHGEAILDLGTHLPRNPRRLKLFLRLVQSLAYQLHRYSPKEIDLKRALLVQMLRVEYPTESLALLQDEGAIEALEMDFALGLLQKMTKQPDKPLPEEQYAPDGPAGRRSRFLSICDAIRERDALRSELGLVQLYHLLDRPPVLTWKELDMLLDARDPDGGPPLDQLAELLHANDPEEEGRRALAVWDKLVKARERVWVAAMDAEDPREINEWLAALPTVDALLAHMGDGLSLFRRDLLGSDQWLQFWKHVPDWDRFTAMPDYLPVRRRERELSATLAASLPPITKAKIWLKLSWDIRTPLLPEQEKATQELTDLREHLLEDFEAAAIGLALDRFAMPEGVDIFWGRHEATPERQVAFLPSSGFHGPDGLSRLKQIAERAPDDAAVQLNFLTYLRMLLYGATKATGAFSMEDCQELLSRPDFVHCVWNAALVAPLNPRVVGSLRQQLADAKKIGVPVPQLGFPVWWKQLEATVFADPHAGAEGQASAEGQEEA